MTGDLFYCNFGIFLNNLHTGKHKSEETLNNAKHNHKYAIW